MTKQIKSSSAIDYSTLALSWKLVTTTEGKKTAAVAAVGAAYEMVATEIVALAVSQGISTGPASDLFLMQCKNALLAGAEETTKFSSMWERAIKASFAHEGSPLVVSAKRKSDQEKTKAARQAQAASKLSEAGVKQAPAKAAIIKALNEDTTGVLTLNLLKALEAMQGGVLIVRMAKVEADTTTGTIKGKVVGKIAPKAAASRMKKAA